MKRTRLLALLALVLAIAGCGGSGGVEKDVGAAVGMVEHAELTAGASNLEQWRQTHGMYAGADPGVPGVTVVRADAGGWCLQTAGAHQDGPAGTPTAGPC